MPRILSVTQGSDQWHAERARRRTASECPAVMGASKYTSRSQLLHQKATGLTPEVDAAKQRLFDKGHEVEGPARAIVEEDLGEDLSPVTVVSDDDRLLASLDGATLMMDVIFEHKLWSEDLAAQVRAGELEPHYFWQLEHQLLVSGAERAIFVCSDGTRERFVSMEYRPVPGRAAQLLAAWDQFERDLAAYVPPAAAEPAPTGRAPDALPALRIEVTGMVTASNLDAFKAHALAVFGGINRDLKTDSDFADAEKTVKWCADVEQRLAAAKQHALSQTASIDELFRTVDEISAEARRVRLDLDKLVKARKESIRGEIVAGGVAALRSHIMALNTRLGGAFMPAIPADFGAAVKGLRTVASVQDAVDTELARAKIAASEAADRVEANFKLLSGYESHLFRDVATLVHKATDDLQAIIAARLAEEQRRQEAERERIRREEQERADQEAANTNRMRMSEISGIQQQVMIATLGRAGVRKGGTIQCIRETLAETEAWPIEESNFGPLTSMAQAAKDKAVAEIRDLLTAAEAARIAAAPAPTQPPAAEPIAAPAVSSQAANVVPMGTRAPDAGARIRLDEINVRLAPIALTADGLAQLGFQPVATEKAAKLYAAGDFQRICAALIAHVSKVSGQQRAA